MKQVSAVLITFNEEAKIGRALDSLEGVADEIVVVDSFSQDGTARVCRARADRFLQREWAGYREQKQHATDLARHDWVLSLDADEALSPGLRRELMDWKREPEPPVVGYWIARKTFFLGRWIEHTTWHPDWQFRLFRKSTGRWKGGRVHESFLSEGRQGRLKGHLQHYTYASVGEYLRQLERFSSLAAADYRDAGRRVGWARLAFSPPWVFFNNYVLRLGFLDGVPGLAASAMSATSVFFKLLKLWELEAGLGKEP